MTTPDVGRRSKPQELDLTDEHHPSCPYGRMSVRQRRRALEATTPQIPSEMNKAVEAVRFVSAHIKNEDDFKEVSGSSSSGSSGSGSGSSTSGSRRSRSRRRRSSSSSGGGGGSSSSGSSSSSTVVAVVSVQLHCLQRDIFYL